MNTQAILDEVLHLRPAERLYLMEQIAKSLDKPDENIEKEWEIEVEKRIDALKNKSVKTYSLESILERYKK